MHKKLITVCFQEGTSCTFWMLNEVVILPIQAVPQQTEGFSTNGNKKRCPCLRGDGCNVLGNLTCQQMK